MLPLGPRDSLNLPVDGHLVPDSKDSDRIPQLKSLGWRLKIPKMIRILGVDQREILLAPERILGRHKRKFGPRHLIIGYHHQPWLIILSDRTHEVEPELASVSIDHRTDPPIRLRATTK